MSYVVGSESEKIVFAADGIAYEPAGTVHAVDGRSIDGSTVVLAYAVCGQPVRVWPGRDFDAAAKDVHDACAALTSGQTDQGRSPRIRAT